MSIEVSLLDGFGDEAAFTSVSASELGWLRRQVHYVDHPKFGAVGDGVADDSAAIQAAITAAEADAGTVMLGPRTYRCLTGLTVAASGVSIVGLGRDASIIDYRGSGNAISTDGTLRRRLHMANFQIELRNGGTSNQGLYLDNIRQSLFENIYINATGTNTRKGVVLVGGATKSTYFNRFVNIDIVAGGTCVEIGDQCNSNQFIGGVWDASSGTTGVRLAILPTSTTTGQIKLIGVAFQGGGDMVQIGGAGGFVRDLGFISCRFEPTTTSNFEILSGTLNTYVLGGSMSGDVVITDDASYLTTWMMPNRGRFDLAVSRIGFTNSGVKVEFGGDTVANLYRRTTGVLKTDGDLDVAGTMRIAQGAASQLSLSGDSVTQAGSNTNAVLNLRSKGTSAVRANVVSGSGTGGFHVGDGAGNIVHRLNPTTAGFFGATAVAKPEVTGGRDGNAAVASLLTALANLGLITDSTSA